MCSQKDRFPYLAVLVLILAGTGLPAARISAQSAPALRQWVYWTRYYLQWNVHEHWVLHAEADNRRFFEPRGGQHQFISHLHLHRQLGKKWELMGGITYSVIFAQNPNAAPAAATGELRPWQAVSFRQAAPKANITHRLRWEERFFSPFDPANARFAFRLRYAALFNIPLNSHWALKTGDEVMVQWGEGVRQAFDQNRLWGGLEFTLPSKRGSIEALYLWLWQKSPSGSTTYDRDVLRLTVTQRMP